MDILKILDKILMLLFWLANVYLILIGNTPIVKLQNITKNLNHEFYAKLEYLNPGGSYKDRIAKYILNKAVQICKLKKGGTIVECTSGKTGVGICRLININVFLSMISSPGNFSNMPNRS